MKSGMKTRHLAALATTLVLATGAFAQQKYPSKPIRMIIPSAPGGGLELAGRQVAQQLSARVGQQVLIDNIAGASQQLGTNTMVRATPDGYTLLFTASSPITIAENFDPRPPYDARRDITGVAMLARNPGLIVINSGVKAANLQEFVALARSQPGKLNFGTPGTGHVFHLITELLARNAGVEMTHVPYKGSAPGVLALLSGDIHLMVQSPEAVREHIRAGKLRALATLEPQRLQQYPDIPTLAEGGQKPMSVTIWYGVLAPAKTSREVLGALERELLAVAKLPEFTSKLREMNFEPLAIGSAEFNRRMGEEFDLWPPLVKSIGMAKAR
jgi:tripartite-type tricarboxylate transporter receptor subunit TctC